MFSFLLDSFLDALIDSAKMLPFLYLIYLLMEYLERKAGHRFPAMLGKAAAVGPLAGGVIGAFPQCGLAAASSGLYAGRVITMGTLIAVFLSSSDEMLPIMISRAEPFLRIVKIVGSKILIGIVSGYLVDLVIRNRPSADESSREKAEDEFADEAEHEGNIFICALRHVIEIFVYVFFFSFAMNAVISQIGEDTIAGLFNSVPVVGELISALIGLVPNCASSVVITELFLDGIIGPGPMFAGLLVNSGVGLMVLFRTDARPSDKARVLIILYVLAVAWGCLIGFSNIVF